MAKLKGVPKLKSFVFMPAVYFMNRLKYSHKFALIFALVALPLAQLHYYLISELNSRVEFSQKELYGNEYLRPLQRMLTYAAEARYQSSIYAAGNVLARPLVIALHSRITENVDALSLTDKRLGAMLNSTRKYHELVSNWDYLDKGAHDFKPEDQDALYVRLIQDIRELISLVGDTSNLILDPDLDTYYLMDSVLLKLPENQDVLGQLRIFEHGVIARGTITAEDKAELIRFEGIIQFNVQQTLKGLAVALANNPQKNLEPALEAPISEFERGSNLLLQTLDHDIVRANSSPSDSERPDLAIQQALSGSAKLLEVCSRELDVLLKARIQRFVVKKEFTLALSMIVLLLVLYLGIAFYLGVMATVSSLEKASEQMISGESGEKLVLTTRDEMGRVVQSFNNIAARIRRERDQAQEESRRAISAEQRIRKSESQLRAIYDSSPQGIFLANEDGDCQYTNRAYQRISGLSLEQTLRRGWVQGIHPEDRERVVREWYETAAANKTYKSTHRFLHADGGVVWAHVVASQIREGDVVTGYVGIVDDVTERKKLESQLVQSQKMETVGVLAGGIAHDLNNQLTPIKGYTDLLLRQCNPEDAVFPLISEINKACVRCADVVQRLMNFSKPSTEKKNPVQLLNVFREVRELLPTFMPSTIQVSMLFEEGTYVVLGNDTDFQTVFMNLVVNARDAMPNGGTLSLNLKNVIIDGGPAGSGHVPGRYVCVSVQDTGSGMPREVLDRIYEPFFTTKTKGRGTGLGLTMVYKIVTSYEGWIDVSSQPGKGTMFQIFLPLVADSNESTAQGHNGRRAEDVNREALPGGHETILFADDEDNLRKMGQVFLNQLGYRVVVAVDGEEAVRVYQTQQHEIAAAILDMTMPKLTGRETIRRILEINPKAKIILASGFTAEGTSEELVKIGAKDYIPKPYTIAQIAHTLRKVLDS